MLHVLVTPPVRLTNTLISLLIGSWSQRTPQSTCSTTTVTWCGGTRDVLERRTPMVTWWRTNGSSQRSSILKTTNTWRTSWCRWARSGDVRTWRESFPAKESRHLCNMMSRNHVADFLWCHWLFVCNHFHRKRLKTSTGMGTASSTCRSTSVRRC